MFFGVLGDLHGDFDALDAVMARHPEVQFWLSVGDVASDDLRYPTPAVPFYWIQGNNEDFDFISGTGLQPGVGPANLHFLPNGTCTLIDGVAVGALGGTFAPTWYDTAADELPYRSRLRTSPGHDAPAVRGNASAGRGFSPAKVRDDKRRHFVREQVEALKATGHVDVLLTHEAPRPFIVQTGARRLDAGKTAVNEVLAALRPKLHFFGHHHRFSDAVRSGVRSIGLDLLSRSYVVVDRDTFDVAKIEMTTR